MRILLVEGDIKIASFIVKGLKSAGYAVDHARDGEEGFRLALTEPYDAAVIDLMLPRRNGLALIKEMRAAKVNTPILILSAKGAAAGAVVGEIANDDAGKGAATGAAVGVVAGGAKQRKTAQAQQQTQQQQQAQTQQSLDKYNKAYSACLEGRGYMIK